MDLFVYGTLMDEDIFTAVCGQLFPSSKAALNGYVRGQVKGEAYPAIRPGNGTVKGVLYQSISSAALARFDHFEGDEYVRHKVMVDDDSGGKLEAQVYVINPGYNQRLLDYDWNFAEFLKRHKQAYLRRLSGASVVMEVNL